MRSNVDQREHDERDRERLETLLFYRATIGLNTQTETELNALLKAYPDVSLADYETIAAAMDIALSKNTRLPLALGKVLAQDIAAEVKPKADCTTVLKTTKASAKPAAVVNKTSQLLPQGAKHSKTGIKHKTMYTADIKTKEYTYRFNRLLILFLGIFFFSGVMLWWWFERPHLNYNPSHYQAMQEERTLLLQKASAEELIQERWLHTTNPLTSKVQGDIVWSSAEQQGYMRFRGLPAVRSGYYQLWLYDYTQADQKPVRGKRFEIEQSRRETIIPFSPNIEIKKPYKFIVTLEQEEGYRSADSSLILLMAQP